MLHPCNSQSRIKKLKEKEKEKEKENRNDLDVLPSHDITSLLSFLVPRNLFYNS